MVERRTFDLNLYWQSVVILTCQWHFILPPYKRKVEITITAIAVFSLSDAFSFLKVQCSGQNYFYGDIWKEKCRKCGDSANNFINTLINLLLKWYYRFRREVTKSAGKAKWTEKCTKLHSVSKAAVILNRLEILPLTGGAKSLIL